MPRKKRVVERAVDGTPLVPCKKCRKAFLTKDQLRIFVNIQGGAMCPNCGRKMGASG